MSTQALQTKVAAVKGQMQHNLDAAMRRGEELDHLQTQAEAIDVEAKSFKKVTTRVKRKEQFKNCKLWLILFAVLGAIVLVVIVIIAIIVGATLGPRN